MSINGDYIYILKRAHLFLSIEICHSQNDLLYQLWSVRRAFTFHFCFAKCFRIFDVTTLVISFVEAMPPEILKNKIPSLWRSLPWFQSFYKRQKRLTMDDPARRGTWISLADFFPWGVWWSPWLNLKFRPSKESRTHIPLFWFARINLHRSRRRKADIRIIWMIMRSILNVKSMKSRKKITVWTLRTYYLPI